MLGGCLVFKFGGKNLFGFGILFIVVLMLFIFVVVRVSVVLLVILRIFIGLCEVCNNICNYIDVFDYECFSFSYRWYFGCLVIIIMVK